MLESLAKRVQLQWHQLRGAMLAAEHIELAVQAWQTRIQGAQHPAYHGHAVEVDRATVAEYQVIAIDSDVKVYAYLSRGVALVGGEVEGDLRVAV